MITRCGLRLADLKRLRRKQLHMTRKATRVEVRIAKNRRQRCLRRILRVDPCQVEEGQSEVVDIFSEQVLGSKGNALQQVNDCRSQQIHQEPNTQSVLVFTLRKKYIQDIALWCDFDWTTTISKHVISDPGE